MTDFSAGPSTLGYLYQARYALFLLISEPEDAEVAIETLDDIVLQEKGTPTELLQAKHHTVPGSLADSSPELWKTVRIWSEHIQAKRVRVPQVKLTLVTTSIAAEGSISAKLRPVAGRDIDSAYDGMVRVAEESNNKRLRSSFEAFMALSKADRAALVASINVLDGSPDIHDKAADIKRYLRPSAAREHRDAVFERLEGWWLGRVILQLRSGESTPIIGFEVYDKIREIAEQFRPTALPIDYLEARPDSIDPEGDSRMFVEQLRAVSISTKRIEKAILDYYRAFHQRSKWARDELLVGQEVKRYEDSLVDEWMRFSTAVGEELSQNETEQALQRSGRKIYNWMEQLADFRIRPDVSEPYVMRGSYHILADSVPPRVWWHPLFCERIEAIVVREPREE